MRAFLLKMMAAAVSIRGIQQVCFPLIQCACRTCRRLPIQCRAVTNSAGGMVRTDIRCRRGR